MPLIRGGPAELARVFRQTPEPGYVDACHLRFLARRAAPGQYPESLAPKQVYGHEFS